MVGRKESQGGREREGGARELYFASSPAETPLDAVMARERAGNRRGTAGMKTYHAVRTHTSCLVHAGASCKGTGRRTDERLREGKGSPDEDEEGREGHHADLRCAKEHVATVSSKCDFVGGVGVRHATQRNLVEQGGEEKSLAKGQPFSCCWVQSSMFINPESGHP